MTDAIKVTGLQEFTRNLKKLDRELPKALRVAFNDASDIVVSDAKPRVPSRSGKAQGSVRARSTQTKARVTGGGARAPYYPWLDFGGRVGRRHSVVRPFISPHGRYIYAAYFQRRNEFKDLLEKALLDVVSKAGLD